MTVSLPKLHLLISYILKDRFPFFSACWINIINFTCTLRITALKSHTLLLSRYRTCSYISDKIMHFKESKFFFFQITSAYLDFRQWNFSHRRKPLLCNYLLHCHLQIFILARAMLKKSTAAVDPRHLKVEVAD